MRSKRQHPTSHQAAATEPKSAGMSEFREIETKLLLEPINPARETFDEEALGRLIRSIQRVGVIEPLCVEPEGEYFRVHAGHRRLIAAIAAGKETIPCRVYQPGQFSGEALKHHENAMREDLNAAEEARHFLGLLDGPAAGDVDKLCDMVQERRDYVEERLLLIQGDEQVFQALKDRAIKIGVAHELNKVKDPARRHMYLDAAIQGGASVRMVRDWRVRGNAMDELVPEPAIPDTNQGFQRQPPAPVSTFRCYICEQSDQPHEMELLYVHRSCARAMERIHQRQAAAGENGGGEQ